MIPDITLPSQSRLLDLKLVEATLFKISCPTQNQIDTIPFLNDKKIQQSYLKNGQLGSNLNV